MNNEEERSCIATQPLEPVLASVAITWRTTTTQAPSSASTMAMSTMTMYGLPPGFVPLAIMQVQNQLGLVAVTMTF